VLTRGVQLAAEDAEDCRIDRRVVRREVLDVAPRCRDEPRDHLFHARLDEMRTGAGDDRFCVLERHARQLEPVIEQRRQPRPQAEQLCQEFLSNRQQHAARVTIGDVVERA
jgi:hypothetical protein